MVVITCESVVDISDAQELKAQLQEALTANEEVQIDASQVERIDTAAMQLLCAFVSQAKDKGTDVVWKSKSEALSKAAEILGFKQLMVL